MINGSEAAAGGRKNQADDKYVSGSSLIDLIAHAPNPLKHGDKARLLEVADQSLRPREDEPCCREDGQQCHYFECALSGATATQES